MDFKAKVDLIKYFSTLICIIVIIFMFLYAGFRPNNIRIEYKDLNIEVSEYEKNAQPVQK